MGLAATTALTAGFNFSCAVRGDDTPRCWGINQQGELGDGILGDETLPNVVSGGAGTVSARGITAGFEYTCARRAAGTAACWGANADGQLGTGAAGASQLTPVTVAGLTNAATIGAAVTEFHTCAIPAGGAMACWGANADGQLGDLTELNRAAPVPVSSLSNAVAMAAGAFHTCGVLADGTARCWGNDVFGQIGIGLNGFGTPDVLSPTAVSNLAGLQGAIAAGHRFTCAINSGGTVSCWGDNSLGQLGNGTNTLRSLPVTVAGLSGVVAIATGSVFACALRADGLVFCWGHNSDGQLGDGSTGDRPTAAAVHNLTNAVAITAGGSHACAVLADGTARCWGNNTDGQLGINSNAFSPLPVPVQVFVTLFFNGRAITTLVNLQTVASIAGGNRHTCALTANGQPYCWGHNVGAIGDGTTINRLTATAVPSFSFNVEPNVEMQGQGHVALVSALANCVAGAQVKLSVTLTQGSVAGTGYAVGKCTGGLEVYPVTVPASGPAAFQTGPAVAQAAAIIIEQGQAVDTQEWSRNVTLAIK